MTPGAELGIFAVSVVAGLIGALAGVGGGILVIPVLTFGFGVDIRLAVGASIISVIATSSGAAAAYVRDRMTDMRVGMFLELATTTGAVCGALLAAVVAPAFLFVLLGIGSGVPQVIAMDGAMRLPMKVSSATSNFMIGVTAAASAGIYLGRGDVDPQIAAPVALGVLTGALIGARLLQQISNRSVRLVFLPVLIAVGIDTIR